MGRALAPFAGNEYTIPVFGFGDSKTGDWTVFALSGSGDNDRDCDSLEEVLRLGEKIFFLVFDIRKKFF